jgi:NAD(P)-dependent dehydrogenase (short-subunit alcohol dehydrogenase family)
MIADLLDAEAAATAAALPEGRGASTHLDVTDDAGWAAAVNATIERFGGIDIVVNNAGIEISGLIYNIDPNDLRRMLDVNVVGTTLGIKHAFRAMRPGGAAGNGGSVINIASVAATIAFPGIAGYSGTKSAVDRITRGAAMESGKLGFGVRVNCIYPGLVPTEMGQGLATSVVELGLFPSVDEAIGAVVGLTPLGRLGEIADMADAVVFLASDQSRFITGAGLPVDGGMGM